MDDHIGAVTLAVAVRTDLCVEVDVGEETGIFDDAFELDFAPVSAVGRRVQCVGQGPRGFLEAEVLLAEVPDLGIQSGDLFDLRTVL